MDIQKFLLQTSAEVAYGLLFYCSFYLYINRLKKRLPLKTCRRYGAVLLAVHSVCLFALAFFVPDRFAGSLVRLGMIIPIVCWQGVFVLNSNK